MDESRALDVASVKSATTVEQVSDREIVVTRTVNGPARLVFKAFTHADLFRQWWVPRSYGLNLLSCEMDVRVRGEYRLVFQHEDSTMAFFGTYTEVTPNSRLVWTNEESDGGVMVTTVTFDEVADRTVVLVHDLYPTKGTLESAIGSAGAMPEAFDQLDELVVSLGSDSSK